jgi:hypothetical protein
LKEHLNSIAKPSRWLAIYWLARIYFAGQRVSVNNTGNNRGNNLGNNQDNSQDYNQDNKTVDPPRLVNIHESSFNIKGDWDNMPRYITKVAKEFMRNYVEGVCDPKILLTVAADKLTKMIMDRGGVAYMYCCPFYNSMATGSNSEKRAQIMNAYLAYVSNSKLLRTCLPLLSGLAIGVRQVEGPMTILVDMGKYKYGYNDVESLQTSAGDVKEAIRVYPQVAEKLFQCQFAKEVNQIK